MRYLIAAVVAFALGCTAPPGRPLAALACPRDAAAGDCSPITYGDAGPAR